MSLSPSKETIAWAERALGGAASVVAVRRMTGGITSRVHRLTIEPRSGRRFSVVLRHWAEGSHATPESGRGFVEHEASVLRGISGLDDVPTPDLIAVSDGEETAGAPALLMTCARGRMLLTPADPHSWVAQIAEMLPRIHAAAIDAPSWGRWIDVDALEVPEWATRPSVWRAAIDAARVPDSERTSTCFIHRDYQHFNLLWTRGRLTAVIDWVVASTGPPDIDVGHCRLNLAVLFSAELAEDFRRAYEAASGRTVDPRWDIHSLLSYDQEWKRFIPIQVGRRRTVDLDGMDNRVEQTLAAAVGRL